MLPRDRLALSAVGGILLWVFWPVLRRIFCRHSGWRTVTTVAGFGVPILDQRCARCGAPRRLRTPLARWNGYQWEEPR
jgi:hypothetical protein